jgi:hypothetical protein
MAIKKILTPNFITNQEYSVRRQLYAYTLEEELAVDDILILSSFEDRMGEVIDTDTATKLVKIDKDGVDSPILLGEVLTGYRIGWKADAVTPVGTVITGDLQYWSIV